MTDKAVYIGMSGASNSMHQLEILTNNLANVNTTGFRADYEMMNQAPVGKNGSQETRVFSTMGGTYTDFQNGPILSTGRDLDVALQGPGFIAVQGQGGKEAYTRAGSLQIDNGTLVTKNGELVLGNGGVINIPAADKIDIAADGTISARLKGAKEMVVLDRIKLVSTKTSDLQKGADGAFYSVSGAPIKPDPLIRLTHGALEGSNVNAVETLTKLIELSRHFEVHTNVMKAVQDDTTKANEILNISH